MEAKDPKGSKTPPEELAYGTIENMTVRLGGTVHYSLSEYSMVQYSIAQYSAVMYIIVQHCNVQYSTVHLFLSILYADWQTNRMNRNMCTAATRMDKQKQYPASTQAATPTRISGVSTTELKNKLDGTQVAPLKSSSRIEDQ